jgi:hypothetical protein
VVQQMKTGKLQVEQGKRNPLSGFFTHTNLGIVLPSLETLPLLPVLAKTGMLHQLEMNGLPQRSLLEENGVQAPRSLPPSHPNGKFLAKGA